MQFIICRKKFQWFPFVLFYLKYKENHWIFMILYENKLIEYLWPSVKGNSLNLFESLHFHTKRNEFLWSSAKRNSLNFYIFMQKNIMNLFDLVQGEIHWILKEFMNLCDLMQKEIHRILILLDYEFRWIYSDSLNIYTLAQIYIYWMLTKKINSLNLYKIKKDKTIIWSSW